MNTASKSDKIRFIVLLSNLCDLKIINQCQIMTYFKCSIENKKKTIILDGITVRGCISRNKQNQQCVDNSCLTCRSNNCNAQIFPEDRLSCMHCEGSSCVNQTNTVDVRYPCAQYTQNDSCYSVFSSGKAKNIISFFIETN